MQSCILFAHSLLEYIQSTPVVTKSNGTEYSSIQPGIHCKRKELNAFTILGEYHFVIPV